MVGRGYADRFVIVVVDGKDDGDALDRGDRTGAWQLRARLDTAHRMDRAQGHTAEPPGWDGALIDLMGSRRWHAGNEGHAPEEMRQRLDPTSCWGIPRCRRSLWPSPFCRSAGVVAVIVL